MNPRDTATRLSDEEVRSLYDSDYIERFTATSRRRLERLVHLLNLRPSDVVADFGCGNGLLLDLIQSDIDAYWGVDFSEDFIALARKNAEDKGFRHARFVAMDIVDFCVQHSETFDKAFTMDFSEHLYDGAFLSLYTAVRSSLKPGGELFLHTPNGDFFVERLKKSGILRQHPQHVAVRNADENLKLLRACGFSEVHVQDLSHYNPLLAWTHMLRRVPVLGALFRARLFIRCVK